MSAFELPSVMDISGAAALKERLAELLDQGAALTLDGAAVERIDASGLQLLLAFFYEARQRDLTVSWHSPSEEIHACARLAGLSEPLQLA